MSDQAHESVNGIGDDVGPVEPTGEVVHWMAPKPLSLGPAGISAAAAGAFALGAVTAVAVLALMHLLGPERQIEPARRWRTR
jgi:hypothetical protein